MSIKLVHITSSLMCGGAEKILYLLVKELQQRDVAQVVFYFHAGPYVAHIESLGVKTHQITGWLYRYDPIFFFRLYTALRQQKPTLIHSLLWAANVSARICAWLQRVQIICAYHNNVDQDGFVRSLFDRITLRSASCVIAVSDQVKHSIKMRGYPGAIRVIDNGIDMQEHNRHNAITRQALGIASDAFVVGAVGRLVALKRFDYLIRTCALWHGVNIHVIIIGQGPLQRELQELIRDLNVGNKVSLIADIALSYYSLFDCFVQPSCKEGISLALLEAMSFAKPCIVMGNGYHSVITHEYDGIVIAHDDQQKLLDVLSFLYNDMQYGISLGRQAAKTVRDRFDVKRMGMEYYNIIMSMTPVSRSL